MVVADHSGDIAEIECDQLHPAVVASGRHQTGLVGFKLTEDNIPGLLHRASLKIKDHKSGLLIYRRKLYPKQIDMKIMRIETQLVPHAALDREMVAHFQYALPAAERFGHETTLQAFHLDSLKSIYVSGRLQVRSYQEFLDKGFRAITLLNDPYYEMALRIATLKLCATVKPTFLGERDRMSLSPAIEFFSSLDLSDESAVEKALKKAPLKIRTVLQSPATRQFACSDAEKLSSRRDIAAAMDLISRFEVIGHINDTLAFASSLGELLELDMDRIPILQRSEVLIRLADQLRLLPVAESYLEDDLILEHYVRRALETDK
ncbi:hypothetical protein QM996_24355 (plasmid) [Sinorhizobium chiapasense]|uniref:hypothetical protein n=1 Tax=Sinorhizobium chiapasense TaxID=501572 RepID=UPI002FE1551C